MKFIDEFNLKLKEDSYIAVEVLIKKSLFPVLQAKSWSGSLMNATLPYGLTNPVFVDVDGNGTFDLPLPEIIELVSENPEYDSMLSHQV